MSIQAMTWVIENSRASGASYAVAISIANHADASGDNSFPSVETMHHEGRCSVRQVQRALKTLQQLGELEIRYREGPNSTNVYRIIFNKPLVLMDRGVTPRSPRHIVTPPSSATSKGDNSDNVGVTPTSPQPSSVNREEQGTEEEDDSVFFSEADARVRWETTLSKLQAEITRPSYATWLAGSVGVEMTNEVLIVEVESAFKAEWLHLRLSSLIDGVAEMPVAFRVAGGG